MQIANENGTFRFGQFSSNFLFPVADLEKSYDDNQRTLEVKAEQLVELEAAVKELLQQIRETVLQKTVEGMKEEGAPYVGKCTFSIIYTSDNLHFPSLSLYF